MTTAAQKRRALADAAALDVARGAFAATAIQAANGRGVAPLPKGMRGSGIYRRETNAVTLAQIPTRRAVKIGKQHWDSRTLRGLLERNPMATNPLTRQPLPPGVAKKYGPKKPKRPTRRQITKLDDAIAIGRIALLTLSGHTAEARRQAGDRLGFEEFLLYRAHWELGRNRDSSTLDVYVRPAVAQRNPFGWFKMIGEGTNRTLVFHFVHESDEADVFKRAARRAGNFITFHMPRQLRG